MTSTEILYDLVDRYGGEDKQTFARDLKKFRTKVRNETLSPVIYAINKTKSK